MSDELESLLAYCRERRRVCPMPHRWNELFEMLRRYEHIPAHGTDDLFGYVELRIPLILALWDASDLRKSERLAEHLAWAASHGALPEVSAYLRSLPEREWHHKRSRIPLPAQGRRAGRTEEIAAASSLQRGTLMSEPDTLESLLAYCQEKRRVCPVPYRWNELWQMLPGREQTTGGGGQPSLPLILGGWDAPDGMKSLRLEEHITWAASHGVPPEVSAFLRALPEREWHHWRPGQEL